MKRLKWMEDLIALSWFRLKYNGSLISAWQIVRFFIFGKHPTTEVMLRELPPQNGWAVKELIGVRVRGDRYICQSAEVLQAHHPEYIEIYDEWVKLYGPGPFGTNVRTGTPA